MGRERNDPATEIFTRRALFSLSESANLQSCNVAFELSSPWMKFESVIATEQYLIVVLFVNLS